MLAIAKRVAARGQAFASVRSRTRKEEAPNPEGEPREKDVFRAYRKQVEKGSILRQFREDVFRRSELTEDWGSARSMNKEHHELEKMLGADKEQMLKKVTDVQARASQNRRLFDEDTGRSLLSDYGNYKSYEKVYPVLDDRNLGELQYLEDNQTTENIYTFISQLPQDYKEKQEVQSIIDQLPVNQQKMTITEYGKKLQKDINDTQRMQARKYETYREHYQHLYKAKPVFIDENDVMNGNWYDEPHDDMHEFTGITKTVDPISGSQNLEATLSTEAVDTIYELYLQGWSVRDISKRYGILPARTKFCVWVRAQLYHEVIPKMGVDYYMRVSRFQQRWNEEKVFCDYGLDVQQLQNGEVLQEISEWNGRMVDAQRREDQYIGAMTKLYKQKKFNKYEMVEVGTVGKQHKRYSLKEWKVFRGKGSDHYFLKNKLLKDLTRAEKKFNKEYY